MQLSVALDNSTTRSVNVTSHHALEWLVTNRDYSCGIFKNNHRKAVNFIQANYIGLDYDGTMTLEQAKEYFKDYKHIIAPTRSHGKKPGDRFRVILYLSEPVTDREVYKRTVRKLLAQFPGADKACVDASRLWYGSQFSYSSTHAGLSIEPEYEEPKHPHSVEYGEVNYERRPEGFSNCKYAILQGLFDKGEGNSAMMSLATTCKKLNYTKEMTYSVCKSAYQARRARYGHGYNKEELWRQVIEFVYGEDYDGAVYNCRHEGSWLHEYCQKLGVNACSAHKSAFNFNGLDKIMTSGKSIEWHVSGMLSKGGMSIWVGKPKSGKSTLVRQLARATSRGETFLGRQVQKGKVLYLALEEQAELLYDQFKKLGMTGQDDIKIHVGGVYGDRVFDELTDHVLETRPALLIIDTLALLANFKDLNDYREVNNVLTKYRDLSRNSGCHILTVHHQNKSPAGGTGSILGSSAIHGAVDCAVILDCFGDIRKLTTSQRGGVPFKNQRIEFEKETETYKLGTADDF